ncbi:MAG: hypothetical protein QG584_1586 [Pseudomonadota bacterium]|nr:hypothetical protein [Pseudomonadota bacterium]
MEIDGRQIVAWLAKASEPERQALIGATYSDSDSEWRIEALQPGKLLVKEYPFDTSCRMILRPLPLFSDGAFFFEEGVGEQVMESVQTSMTTQELRIETAKSYLSSLGFPLVDLGGDTAMLSVFDALSLWEKEKAIPAGEVRSRLYEIFKRTVSLQRLGSRFFERWVKHKEGQTTPMNYDAQLRLCWATLCRHSGRPESSLLATDVVDLPSNQFPVRGPLLAELCTVRAATMMDMAEQKASSREDYLAKARSTLNKANALAEGNSDYVRNAYMRLKKLESGGNF